jgi:hypothetical protein
MALIGPIHLPMPCAGFGLVVLRLNYGSPLPSSQRVAV